jgi:hypothetical protein
MGFLLGGLISKHIIPVSEKEILKMLGRENYSGPKRINMESATSADFFGVGIASIDGLSIILGRDIPHSCSFEKSSLTSLDESLEALSTNGDIVSFLVNSISDTYAWSIFRNGKRVRGKSIVERKILSDFGNETEYDKGIKADDAGLIHLIERFSGYSYFDLVFKKEIPVNAYYDQK